MREAMDYYEMMLECCKTILAAETEEDVEVIKEQITSTLNTTGWSNAEIEHFMSQLDEWIEKVENDEVSMEEINERVARYQDSEEMLNICISLTTAKTEEAAETFRQELTTSLAYRGRSDEEIAIYMSKVDQNIALLQTVGLHIDQNGYLVEGGRVISPRTETMQLSPEELPQTYAPGIAAGAGLSLVIGLLLLRTKVFKNKKNKGL